MSYPKEIYVDGVQVHNTPTYALAPEGWKLSTPQPREAVVDLARRHGVANDTSYLGAAIAELRVAVLGDTGAELRAAEDTLKGLMRPGRDFTVSWAPYAGADLRQMSMRLAGQIDTVRTKGLICFVGATFMSSGLPLALSADLQEESYDPTQSTTGVGWTLSTVGFLVPLILGGTPLEGALVVENLGNMPTPPLWIVEGPVDDAVITDVSNGDAIVTTLSLLAGETAYIDVERRELRLDAEDGTLRLDLIDEENTTWFELETGVNAIRLSGDSMAGGQTSLTARWRHAWLPD